MKAEFTNKRPRQTLISGKSGHINCTGVGTPAPQFEWKRGGNKTSDNGRFTEMPDGSLRVNPVLPEDEGFYVCTMKQNKKYSTSTENQDINVSVIGM